MFIFCRERKTWNTAYIRCAAEQDRRGGGTEREKGAKTLFLDAVFRGSANAHSVHLSPGQCQGPIKHAVSKLHPPDRGSVGRTCAGPQARATREPQCFDLQPRPGTPHALSTPGHAPGRKRASKHVCADCQGTIEPWLPLLRPSQSLPLASRSLWGCLDSVLSRPGLDVGAGGWVDLGLRSIVDSMKQPCPGPLHPAYRAGPYCAAARGESWCCIQQ